ncbi:MAG: hypothetical protein OXC13_13065 [Caldilineaceae bacterium]|nr:hypothetical protein [Caldilineaceae bacterium]
MIASLRALVRGKYPFRLRLLAYGVVGGGLLSLTSLMLGQSPDLATTTGLAGCVSITVGIWAGSALAKWSLYLTVHRIVAVLVPVLEVLQDLKPITVESEQTGSPPEAQLPWHKKAWIWCLMDLPIFCLILTPVFALLVLLDLGYGLYDLNLMRSVTSGIGVLALVGLSGQHLAIWRLPRGLTRLTQPASSAPSLRPVAQQDRERKPTLYSQLVLSWQKATRVTPVWIARITGVPVDEVDPEGFPGIAA